MRNLITATLIVCAIQWVDAAGCYSGSDCGSSCCVNGSCADYATCDPGDVPNINFAWELDVYEGYMDRIYYGSSSSSSDSYEYDYYSYYSYGSGGWDRSYCKN